MIPDVLVHRRKLRASQTAGRLRRGGVEGARARCLYKTSAGLRYCSGTPDRSQGLRSMLEWHATLQPAVRIQDRSGLGAGLEEDVVLEALRDLGIVSARVNQK